MPDLREEDDLHYCVCCDEEPVPPDGPSYCRECLHDPTCHRRHKRLRERRIEEYLDGGPRL